MRGIEDHRTAKGLQLRQAAVINHQVILAEAPAALGEPEPAAGGLKAELRQLAHQLGHALEG